MGLALRSHWEPHYGWSNWSRDQIEISIMGLRIWVFPKVTLIRFFILLILKLDLRILNIIIYFSILQIWWEFVSSKSLIVWVLRLCKFSQFLLHGVIRLKKTWKQGYLGLAMGDFLLNPYWSKVYEHNL